MESQSLSKYNSIEIDGRRLYYKGFCEVSEVGTYYWTEFYETTEIIKYRKWFFFGPVLTKEVPKVLFTIFEDCNNPLRDREWWSEAIRKKLSIESRKIEIDSGKLI